MMRQRWEEDKDRPWILRTLNLFLRSVTFPGSVQFSGLSEVEQIHFDHLAAEYQFLQFNAPVHALAVAFGGLKK
jgi:hypothetical protein